MIDVESLHIEDVREVVSEAVKRNAGIIFSYHNFESTPTLAEMEMLLNLHERRENDVFKIACRVNSREDALRLVRFTVDHSRDRVAVMGMGEEARWMRFVLPLLGSVFAYAGVGEGTAPGQPSIEEYVEIWKLMKVEWE